MRAQVAIVGAGPAGLPLGHLLFAEGVEVVMVERASADHVRARIRAGVLETTPTDLLRRLGIDDRGEGVEPRRFGRRLSDAGAYLLFFKANDHDAIARYSDRALARVWKAARFSWQLTLTHRFPGATPFDRRIQRADLDYIASSVAARTTIAENHAGLPL